MAKITDDLVKHIAKLANIPVTEDEQKNLAAGFNKTLETVDKLFSVDTGSVKPTHQVTGLENILREDAVNPKNTLSQEKALSNAKEKHNGYFVVDQILEED